MRDDARDYTEYSHVDFAKDGHVHIDGERLRSIRDGFKIAREKLSGLMEKRHLEAALSADRIKQIETHAADGRPVPSRTSQGSVYLLAAVLGVRVGDLLPVASLRVEELSAVGESFVKHAREVIEALPADHPHLSFQCVIWGSASRTVEVISRGREKVVRSLLDAGDYSGCLALLTEEERREIHAFADLSVPTEVDYWLASPNPEQTWVCQRTFWIKWAQVHDRKTFSRLVTLFRNQSNFRPAEYKVRVGIIPDRLDARQHPHPLGNHAVGRHLLLVPPTLVGGYLRNPTTQTKNVVESDSAVYRQAIDYYQLMNKNTFEFLPRYGEAETRGELNKLEHAGYFDRSWKEHETRDDRYFDLYAPSIHIWDPWYDETNDLCSRAVQHEILKQFNKHPPVTILEIGVGLGGLTQLLLSWIDEANGLVAKSDYTRQFVGTLYGIDVAQQMIDRMPPEIRNHRLCKISQRKFDRNYVPPEPVDIICGSLVLHDIIDANPAINLPAFLDIANRCLAPGGALVLADIFISADEVTRARELARWTQGMQKMGLPDEQIEVFKECNPEMLCTVTEQELTEQASKHGFAYVDIKHVTAYQPDIPFKCVVMRKQ